MADGGAITLRLGVKGQEQVRTALQQLGPAGAGALRQIEAATRQPAVGLRAIDAGVASLKGQLMTSTGAASGFVGALWGMGPAGMAAAAAFAALTAGLALVLTQGRQALEFFDRLGDAATKLHTSASSLVEWRGAAILAGAEATDFDKALEGLQNSLGRFTSGVGDVRVKKAFKELGVTPEDIRNLNSWDDALMLVADRLADVGSEAERISLSKQIGVYELLPLLERGSAGIRQFHADLREMGIEIDDHMVGAVGDLHDKVELASMAIDIQMKTAFVELAPILVGIVQEVANLTRELNYFIDSMKRIPDRRTISLERKLDSIDEAMDSPRRFIPGYVERAQKRRHAITDELGKRVAEEDDSEFDPGFRSGGSGSKPKGGGAKHAPTDRTAEELARAQEAELRAREAILRDTLRAAGPVADSGDLLDQLLAIELQQVDAELKSKSEAVDRGVKDKHINAAKAEEIKAVLAKTAEEKRQLIQAQDTRDRAERELVAAAENLRFQQELLGYAAARLQDEASMAQTSSERRALLLRELDARQRLERLLLDQAANEQILAGKLDESGKKALLEAQKAAQAAERVRVGLDNQGPLAAYSRGLGPFTAAGNREFAERELAGGFGDLSRSLARATLGLEGFDESFQRFFEGLGTAVVERLYDRYVFEPLAKQAETVLDRFFPADKAVQLAKEVIIVDQTTVAMTNLTLAANQAAMALSTMGAGGGFNPFGGGGDFVGADQIFAQFDPSQLTTTVPNITIPGFADGGVFWAGERGPEPVFAPRGTRVVSHEDATRELRRGGAVSVKVEWHGSTPVRERADVEQDGAGNIKVRVYEEAEHAVHAMGKTGSLQHALRGGPASRITQRA